MKLSVDDRQIRKLVKHLEATRRKALPYATREYVNSAAFLTRDLYIKRASESMKLRSPWTKRSIQVDKAATLEIAQQVARVGSVADYMATQEEGATLSKKGKRGVPIPAAAPSRRKNRGRTPSGNRLSAIQLAAQRVTGIRQKRNAAAIAIASRRGGGVVFLDLGRNKGLYRVSGTKRGIRIRKVWDLSKPSVMVPRNPMMREALVEVTPQLPRLAVRALEYQLKRWKVLGYV